MKRSASCPPNNAYKYAAAAAHRAQRANAMPTPYSFFRLYGRMRAALHICAQPAFRCSRYAAAGGPLQPVKRYSVQTPPPRALSVVVMPLMVSKPGHEKQIHGARAAGANRLYGCSPKGIPAVIRCSHGVQLCASCGLRPTAIVTGGGVSV